MQTKTTAALLTFLILFSLNSFAQKVKISSDPSTADIYVNGKKVGIGEIEIKVHKNECITVQIGNEGYLWTLKEYCNKRGMPSVPKSDYIRLAVDDSYQASTKSDIANNDIVMKPRKGSVNENWKTALRVVTDYFDAIEVSDSEVKYLRTSWIIDNFAGFTVRTRVILRYTNESPQEMKIKLVSERANGSGTSAKDDEKFKAWDRVLKKYNNLLDEAKTRTSSL